MTNSILYAFILSFSAGISTVIGALIILFNKNKNNKIIVISLSFAAGVMICVSLIDLLPNCYIGILNTISIFPKIILTLIFMVIGIIISMLIDKYLPDNSLNKANNNSLYKVGIISMIAIIMHNIPEGISIAVPIYYSTNNKVKAIGYAFLSGMSEVLGSVIAYLFLSKYINEHIMAALYAIIAGIMIHISVYELIPGAYKDSTLKPILKYMFIGIVVMLVSHLIIN